MLSYKDGWIIKDNGFSYDTEKTKASVFAICKVGGYILASSKKPIDAYKVPLTNIVAYLDAACE